MDKVAELKKTLREVVGANPNLPIRAKVLEVSGEVCRVVLKSGLELSDVKLKASINHSENELVLEPVVGSEVLLLSLSGDLENLTVIKVDKIAKIRYTQGYLEVEIDSETGKLKVENETCSLHGLMSKMATIVRQLKVFTPAGPSGNPLPDTIERVQEFENMFNALLNDN